MSWERVPMQLAAILAVSLSPALKAAVPPGREAFPPCARVLALNEGRHRRRVWDAARKTMLEKPMAITDKSGSGA